MADRDEPGKSARGDRAARRRGGDSHFDADRGHGEAFAPRSGLPAPGKRTLTQRLAGSGRGPSAGQLVEQAELYLDSSQRDALAALEAAVAHHDSNAAAHAWSHLSFYLAIVEQCLKDAEAKAQDPSEDPSEVRRVADVVLATRSLGRQIHTRGLRHFSQLDPVRAADAVRELPMVGPGYGSALPARAELRVAAQPRPHSNDPPPHRPVRANPAAIQAKGPLPEPGMATETSSVQARAAAGVAEPGTSLPHRDSIQAAFGRHDIGGIEAHVGGPAADAAGDIGALAYATGHHVAFARAPDLHTAAHEAAHVVQQRAGVSLRGGVGSEGDPYERHADRVADAVVAGRCAETILDELAAGGQVAASAAPAVQRRPAAAFAQPVNAALYLHLNTVEAKEAIGRHLRAVSWPEPDARLVWRGRVAFLDELLESLDQLLPTFHPPSNLQKLAFPADPLAVIDPLRPITGFHQPSGDNLHVGGRVGSSDWQPRIGIAIAQTLEASIISSLARLGPRWLDAAERLHGDVGGEGVTVPYQSLVTSHWMDRAVGRAMAARGVFHVRPAARGARTARDRADTPADGTPGAGSLSPLRPVQLEWQGARSPELWNFVRAMRPADATVEEVAAQLFGDGAQDQYGEPASFLAYGISAVPPLFGIPPLWAKNFEQARAHAPGKSQPPPDDSFGAQYAAVARSKLGDEAALAQATPSAGRTGAKLAPAQAPPDTKALLDLLVDSQAQAAHLVGLVGAWGLASTVAIALDWIHRKQAELVAADPDARARWAPVLRAQKANLSAVGAGVVQVTRAATELGIREPQHADAAPLRAVLHTYAHAAATSHLVDTSRELIARAARQQAQLPLVALRTATRSLGAAMTMLDQSTAPGDQAARELSADGYHAEKHAHAMASELMAGGQVSPDQLDEAMLSSGELALKARIAALGPQLQALEDAARATRAGLSGEAAAAFSADFRQLAPTCAWIRHELDWIAGRMASPIDGQVVAPSHGPLDERAALGRKQRHARLELAHSRLSALAHKHDVAAFLRKGAEMVQWQAFRTVCVKVAVLLGVSIAGGVVGGAFGRVVGGVLLRAGAPPALAKAAGGATAFLVETGASSAAQTVLFGDSFAQALLENAIAGAGTLAMLKQLERGVDAARVLSQQAGSLWHTVGRAGKLVLRESAAIAGHTIMGAALGFAARKLVTGQTQPAPETIQEWLLQGATIAVGRYVGSSIEARLARLEPLARLDRATIQPLVAAEQNLGRLARTLEREPEASAALDLLARRALLLQQELELVTALTKDPARLRAAGLGRDAAKLKHLVEGELEHLRDPELAPLSLHLAGLEELIPGSLWKGTPTQIQASLAALRRSGATVHATRDTATGRWTIKIGDRSLELHERIPDPLETTRRDESLLDILNQGSAEEIKRATGLNDTQASAIIAERQARRASHPDQPAFGKVFDIQDIGAIRERQAGDLQAKQKWAQIELDDGPTAHLRDQFRREFEAMRSDPANGSTSDYELMRAVISRNPGRYCLKGDPVELAALQAHGAFSKVIGMEAVFQRYLTPDAKAQLESDKIRSASAFAAAVKSDPTLFESSMLDMSAVVSGQNSVAWWAPRGNSSAGTAAELVQELALDPSYYVGGLIRVTVDPNTAHAAKFRKPTPYDGIAFGEWVREPTRGPLGLTGGGTPEAVGPPIPLSQATQVEIFIGGAPVAPRPASTTPGTGATGSTPPASSSAPAPAGSAGGSGSTR